MNRLKKLLASASMPEHLRWAHNLKPGDCYEDFNFNKSLLIRKEYDYRIPFFLDNFLYKNLNIQSYVKIHKKISRWFSFVCCDILLFGISNDKKTGNTSVKCSSVAGGDANQWDKQQNEINIEEYDKMLRS